MVDFAYPAASGVDVSGLNPAFAQRLSDFEAAALKAGIPAHVISAYRSPEKQAMLAATHQGTGSNPVAPAGQSYHNFGMAADVQADDPKNQQKLWNIAGSYGLQALGLKDPNHFQFAGWKIGDPLPSSTVPFTQPHGTTLNTAPQGAGAPNPSPGTVPPPQPNNANVSITGGAPNPSVPNKTTPGQGIGQGIDKLREALAGPPIPSPMQAPNLAAHTPQIDPAALQQMLLAQRSPYGKSLSGGPFDDSQGNSYA